MTPSCSGGLHTTADRRRGGGRPAHGGPPDGLRALLRVVGVTRGPSDLSFVGASGGFVVTTRGFVRKYADRLVSFSPLVTLVLITDDTAARTFVRSARRLTAPSGEHGTFQVEPRSEAEGAVQESIDVLTAALVVFAGGRTPHRRRGHRYCNSPLRRRVDSRCAGPARLGHVAAGSGGGARASDGSRRAWWCRCERGRRVARVAVVTARSRGVRPSRISGSISTCSCSGWVSYLWWLWSACWRCSRRI